MKLSLKQTQALDYLEDKITKEIIYGGGAGGGKSILGCYWILKNCYKYPGTRWLIGRSKGKTLKETTLNSFFQVAKIQGLKADIDFFYNQQSGLIKFPNGSEVLLKDLFLYPSDPDFDELGSLEISGAFIDECNQIVEKAWNIVKSRIRYKLDEYDIIPKILGTCNPSRGYVYYNFYKPYRDGVLDNSKAFIESLVDDNPFISQYYKENLQSLDTKSKQRLLLGNWDYLDETNGLFKYANLVDIFTNTVEESNLNYLIVDVAGEGQDSTKFSYWEGLTEKWRKTFNNITNEDIIQKIREFAAEYQIPYSRITVDAIGIGESIGNSKLLEGIVPFKSSYTPIKTNESIVALPNVHYTKYVPLTSDYANLRSQCLFTLSEKVNNHKIASRVQGIDKEKVIEELSLYQDITKNDGKRTATGKDDIKALLGRSPDDSDCFIMRMYFVVRETISPEQSERQMQVRTALINQFEQRKNNISQNSTK